MCTEVKTDYLHLSACFITGCVYMHGVTYISTLWGKLFTSEIRNPDNFKMSIPMP